MRATSGVLFILLALSAAFPPFEAAAASRSKVARDEENVVQKTIREASRLQEAGKTREAIRTLSRAAKSATEKHQAQRLRIIEINLRLGRLLEAGEGSDELAEKLHALLENASGLDKEKAFLFSARVLIRIGKYEHARKLLNRYLDDYPEPSQQELRQFRETARRKRGASRAASMSHPRLLYRYWATQVLWKASLVGEPVPDFEFTTLSGKTVTPETFKGKVLLMNIWQSSSLPSTSVLPGLKKLHRSYKSDGLAILGLSLDQNESALKGYLEKHELSWPQVHLGEKRRAVSDKFFVQTIPATYLVDRQGIIRGVDLRGTVLRQKLDEVISK